MTDKGSLAVPAYQRIEEDLRTQIHAGRWQPNETLPSRRALAQEYRVDLGTLQRAITGLVVDGTLHANARRGTTVAAQAASSRPVGKQADRAEAVLGIVTGFLPQALTYGDNDHYWTQTVLSALERVFCGAGGVTQVFNQWRVGQAALSFSDSIAFLREKGVSALVVIALHEDPSSLAEALAAAGEERLPIVLVTSSPIDRPLPHVFYDQSSAGYQAAQHLIRRGWNPLLFLAPFTADWVEARLAGARRAVTHAELPETALRDPDGERHRRPWEIDQEAAGYQAARVVLAADGLAGTGVIAVNDAVAFGARRAAREFGLSDGRDFALLGFDDNPQAGLTGLTSLRPPLEALGEEAARLVLHRLRGEKTALQVSLQSHLISRASTLALPAPLESQG